MDGERVLFLPSTPLHSFWSLGLAYGPFAQASCRFALIDQRAGARDFVAEAVERLGSPRLQLRRYAEIGKSALAKWRNARRVLDALQRETAEFAPQRIVVGNDRRVEFHAAMHVCRTAAGASVDDGMFSYVPMKPPRSGALARVGARLAERARSAFYGFPAEQPAMIGGSRAVQEAWVMLPSQVHAQLAHKRLHAIEPRWFAEPGVRAIAAEACALAGLDPAQLAPLRLLLVLPHPQFLRRHAGLVGRLQRLAQDYVARGQHIAFKSHPRAHGAQLALPPSCLEIPQRLPIELLAPLLSDLLVVGTLTTPLISLRHLCQRIEVRSLAPAAAGHSPAQHVYQALGIDAFDEPRGGGTR